NTTPENVAANSLIGTFTSTDPDKTPQTFTYRLVTGTGSTDNASFAIANNQLRIINSPDFESKSSYSIRVRTTDQGGLSYEKVFTVGVININEAPTALVLSNNTTSENVAANSLIGNFTSTDPDSGNTFTYSLVAGTGSTDNASFAIANNELRIINSPDFEAKNNYSIRVRTTDQGGLFYEKIFVVDISNVNEAPVLATIENQTIAVGTLLNLSAIATDPDRPTNLTYSLESNAPTGASINPITGVFTWTPTESQAGTYTIGIRVTDDGNPSLSNVKTFQTVVINPNLAPTDLALSPNSIAENVPISTEVGSFSSTDPDTGNSSTYSLVNGIGDINNNLFTIENGKLKLNFSPDFETQNSYSIRVKTTDQGGL
ncbi:MAG: cadherin domain-containing protein, partial [Pseudanabaena sp.]